MRIVKIKCLYFPLVDGRAKPGEIDMLWVNILSFLLKSLYDVQECGNVSRKDLMCTFMEEQPYNFAKNWNSAKTFSNYSDGLEISLESIL